MVTRRASILCTVLFVSVMIFVASQAWAVVVDMTVKDAVGPVPNMEITFTPEDPNLPTTTGRTDPQGKVVDRDGKAVVLLPGKYKVAARGRDHVTSKGTYTIGPGDTTSIDITVDPIMPWMVQNPPCSLCFGVGAGYYGQWAQDVKIEPGEKTIIRIPGQAPIIEIDASGRVVRFNSDLNAGVAHLAIGISPLPVGSWQLYPALNIQAGDADLTFDAIRKVDGMNHFSLRGRGPLVGAGVGVVATYPNSPWYLGVTYDYSTLVDAELDEPCRLFDSVTSCTTAVANSHSHSIAARAGFNLPSWAIISPYVGFRGTLENSDLKIHTSLNVAGRREGVTFDTSAQFTRKTLDGIAGVDAHFVGPFFGRLETTFNGSDVSLMFKIIYGLSWVDP